MYICSFTIVMQDAQSPQLTQHHGHQQHKKNLPLTSLANLGALSQHMGVPAQSYNLNEFSSNSNVGHSALGCMDGVARGCVVASNAGSVAAQERVNFGQNPARMPAISWTVCPHLPHSLVSQRQSILPVYCVVLLSC